MIPLQLITLSHLYTSQLPCTTHTTLKLPTVNLSSFLLSLSTDPSTLPLPLSSTSSPAQLQPRFTGLCFEWSRLLLRTPSLSFRFLLPGLDARSLNFNDPVEAYIRRPSPSYRPAPRTFLTVRPSITSSGSSSASSPSAALWKPRVSTTPATSFTERDTLRSTRRLWTWRRPATRSSASILS